MRHRLVRLLVLVAVPCALVAAAVFVSLAAASGSSTYTPGTPSLATIANGTSAAPWNEFQGDSGSPAYATQAPGALLPTYTPGGATTGSGASAEPNLAVYPGAGSGTDGVAPYPSGVAGTPGPLDGYCGSGNNVTEAAGSPVRQPGGTTLPFAPAYFPHVVANADGSLTGYFDYRPKDADEAIVAAGSTDGGKSWTYQGEALEQNPGYCPSADVNDDGEGHPNVITVGGVSRLYTLERAAGDNAGVGMLVHTLSPTAANPLNGVPAAEQTGIDPDDFASSAVAVPFTGGSAVTINLSTPIGTGPEQLLAGKFVDLTQTPVPTAASIIACTGVGAASLTGCTTAASGGINVTGGDLIEQVIGTAGGAATIPAGPNTTNGDGGLASLNVTFATQVTAAIYNADAPNRVYVDGVAVYCSQANANPTSKIENCTTGPTGSPLSVASGDPITSDPIAPATATQTSGLVAPDGIVGVLPGYPGAPGGSTVVMYTEKILNYFVAGTTTNSSSTAFGSTITFTPSASETDDMPSAISTSSPVTVYMGDVTTSTIVTVTCTGLTTGTTDQLTGCTTTAASGDKYNATSLIGSPGAAIVPSATLNQTGEGAGLTPSAKNVAKLLKNNEDETVLRVAYTTDGITFSSAGLANNGVISGSSNGASNYGDINNPSSTTSPTNLNAYASPGTADATEMRFVGSAGSIITNPDGSYGLFLSGAWAADGDSDAYNQIFYSSSTDGESWSVPVSVVSTDYTFAASAAQDTALAASQDASLGISAYYSGRAYGPSVVQNADGTLTMVFAGYRLPKTIAAAGTVLGTNTGAPYTVGATDPALYRNILTVTLGSATSPGVATSTAVTSSSSTSALGQSVTYTATVNVPSPGTGTPTATVAFTDGSTTITGCGSVSLSHASPAVATCTTTPSSLGSHAIQAAYSGDSNYLTSSGTLTQLVGATVPGAPTGVSAVAGDRLATVSWTAPASNGGAAITSYTVTASPGGFTTSGTESPLTIAGLTNDTNYTFTVTARNAVGVGSASAPSAAVRPAAGEAPATPPQAPATATATATLTPTSTTTVTPGAAAVVSVTAGATVVTVLLPAGAVSAQATVTARVAPSSAVSGASFAVGTSAIQVSVTSSGGVAITEFAAPLDLQFPDAPTGIDPAYSADGTTWVEIPQVPAAPALPVGWPDGWYRDSGGTLHILTRHATYFGLLTKASKAEKALALDFSASQTRLDLTRTHSVVLHLATTLSGTGTIVLSRNGKALGSWHVSLTGALRTLTIALPKAARRAGRETLALTSSVGGETVTRTIALTLTGHTKS